MSHPSASDRRSRLLSRIEALCAEATAGRRTGSPEGLAARQLILGWMQALPLEPAAADGSFVQPLERINGANLLGKLPGHGACAERALLLVAHYDHLGRDSAGRVFWGADDNAAAVAILLEAARELAAGPPLARAVWICALDAEEPPFFLSADMGARCFVARPPLPLARIDTCVVMDLVGHAVGPPAFPEPIRRSLFVLGAETGAGTLEQVRQVQVPGLWARPIDLDLISPLSDYQPFREAGVPVLFLSCGRSATYHTPSDSVARLDLDKIDLTVGYLVALTRALAERPEPVVAPRPDADAHLDTVEQLLEMGAQLAPLVPAAAAVGPRLALLRSKLRRGEALSRDQVQTLELAVLQLEQLAGG